MKRNSGQNLLQNIEKMHSTNSELFWDMLKRLKSNTFENKNLNENSLSAQSLTKHYKDLLQRSLVVDIGEVRKEPDSSVFVNYQFHQLL